MRGNCTSCEAYVEYFDEDDEEEAKAEPELIRECRRHAPTIHEAEETWTLTCFPVLDDIDIAHGCCEWLERTKK